MTNFKNESITEKMTLQLFNCVKSGDEQELVKLINIFASPEQRREFINQIDNRNQMPLHIAIRTSQTKIAEILIGAGADLTSFDRLGRSALHLAIIQNNFIIFEQLIRAGANAKQLMANQTSPITLAVRYKHILMTLLLIQLGEDARGAIEDEQSLKWVQYLSQINLANSISEQIMNFFSTKNETDKEFVKIIQQNINKNWNPQEIKNLLLYEKQKFSEKKPLSSNLLEKLSFFISYLEERLKNPEIYSLINPLDFRSSVTEVKQSILTLKIAAYLRKKNIQAENANTKTEDKVEKRRLEMEIKVRTALATYLDTAKGYCHGLTLFWLYRKFHSEEGAKNFHKLLEKITSWDEVEDIDTDFEKLFAHIEWLHKPMSYQTNAYQHTFELLLEDPKEDPLIREHQFTWLFTRDELTKYLESIIQDERMIWLATGTHSMGLLKRNGIIYFYNPALRFGEQSFTSISELQKLLEDSIGVANNYFPLTFSSFRASKQAEVSYATAEKYEDEFLKKHVPPFRVLDNNEMTALYVATVDGDSKTLEKLLMNSVPYPNDLKNYLNQYTEEGMTVLHEAIEVGNSKIVKLLLDYGADPKQQVKFISALERSVIRGHTEIASLLLKKGVDIDMVNRIGETALQSAIRANNIEMVKFLINSGADINKFPKYSEPLLIVAMQSCLPAVILLIRAGADVNKTLNYPQFKFLQFVAKITNNKLISQQIIDIFNNYLTENKEISYFDQEFIKKIQMEIMKLPTIEKIRNFLEAELLNLPVQEVGISVELKDHLNFALLYLSAIQSIQSLEKIRNTDVRLSKSDTMWSKSEAATGPTTQPSNTSSKIR